MKEEWIRTPRTARFHWLGGGGPDSPGGAEGSGPDPWQGPGRDPGQGPEPEPGQGPGPDLGQGPEEVWFVLHGYRQLSGRFLRYFEALDDGTRLVAAPEALSRFYVDPAEGRHGGEDRVGASWMTREDRRHEIADYVEYLDRLADLLEPRAAPDARRIVLGFSQGGHTAARWAVSGRRSPDELVLWGSHLPEDLPPGEAEASFATCRVTLVRGSEDVHRDPERAEAEEERLRSWGVEPEILAYQGGHRIEREPLQELADAVRERTLRTRR